MNAVDNSIEWDAIPNISSNPFRQYYYYKPAVTNVVNRIHCQNLESIIMIIIIGRHFIIDCKHLNEA